MKVFTLLLATALSFGAQKSFASADFTEAQDFLVKFKTPAAVEHFASPGFASGLGGKVEKLGLGNWAQVTIPPSHNFAAVQSVMQVLKNNPEVEYVQPNYKIHMIEDYAHPEVYQNVNLYNALLKMKPVNYVDATTKPDLPVMIAGSGTGDDPLFKNQWGMQDIGVKNAWKYARGKGVIVAVLDSGVDYTHEDLVENMWRNPGEMGFDSKGHDKSNNQVDDDGNGYIDDVMGWDFSDNDNKPYDVHGNIVDVILAGKNPGHGTHCAGNVAARADNGKGTVGVAPEAQIMDVRFISEGDQGSTAQAVKAILYAVNNGARVISNSWGSEGDDPKEAGDNQALKDVITQAQEKGVIFAFAAGNGHNGVGYDNDTDPKPGVPASYPIDNIISVAAIDKENNLGKFSNWGAKTVHIAAPGVQVFSTTVDNTYSDTLIDIVILKATWDGTSMATPHVAGAAALYLSKHPNAKWQDVKQAIIDSATPIDSMKGKSVSGGKLNVEKLLSM